MKVGFGFDAHALVEGRPLMLGGIRIDYPRGLEGHSDGDVVLHSLSDAILGSCAAGDIGTHFHDDDSTTAGIDSKRILEFSLAAAKKDRLKPHNLDIVVVADKPKLSSWYDRIRESLANSCGIGVDKISIKAKTTEGTLVDRNSMACFAIVLMEEM